MNEDILKSIDHRLTTITKLLALDVVKGRQFQDQVKLLHDVGMQPSEIAEYVGKTPNNIRVVIHGLKKKSKPKGETNEWW